MTKRILSVGQCIPDHYSITRAIQEHFDAEIVSVDTSQAAIQELSEGKVDVVLVNRIYDVTGERGLEFIRQLKSSEQHGTVPVLLVSNLQDAQQSAVQDGALPGFGKAALGSPEMVQALQSALSETE